MTVKEKPSERFSAESVALSHIARRQSAIQPALALRARAVREGFRNHESLRFLLQPVVAYRARHVQPFLEESPGSISFALFFWATFAQTPTKQSACTEAVA